MQSSAIAILFWLLCLASCGYAVALGGWEGRWTTVIVIVATLATMASNRVLDVHWYTTNELMLLVDFATFVGVYIVAARSERWWPIWFAAFQLNTVAAHIATIFSPEFSARVYHGYEGVWAIPCLLIMVFGIYRDRMWGYRHGIA